MLGWGKWKYSKEVYKNQRIRNLPIASFSIVLSTFEVAKSFDALVLQLTADKESQSF